MVHVCKIEVGRRIETLKVQLHAIFVSLEVKNGQFQVYVGGAHYICGLRPHSGADKVAKINRNPFGDGVTVCQA